jgi:Fe-S-cluster-containing dehydrogenase component
MTVSIAKKRYAMAVDTWRCVGCTACILACNGENALPSGLFRNWVATETDGHYPNLAMEIRSERCNQCDDSPCVTNCPTGASYVGEGGIVLIDRSLCTGCKACIVACPYSARTIHPDGYADKCTFCDHRVARGDDPACVSNCPTQALTFGDLNDPDSTIARLLRERRSKVLRPEMGTKPNVYYV